MPVLKLPRPHVAQQQVIDSAKRFNVLCAGRRWGKSELAMDRVLHSALRGMPVAWFSPTYRTLSDVFRELQRRLHPVTRDISQQERRIELHGGGTVEAWSLDNPDAARGRGYGLVVLDEAALIPNLQAAWTEGIRPMLAERRGSAWFISTPKGTANFFYTLFQYGADELKPDWTSWRLPTESNPYVPAEEIEAMRQDLTDLAFGQEVDAQFISWQGAVFRHISDCITEPDMNTPCVAIGVDWAGTGGRGDFTVFTGISTRGQVLAIDRFRGLEYSLQRARLEAFWERLGGKSWIFAERNFVGDAVIEQLRADGLPVTGFQTSNQSKAEIIQRLVMAFERRIIRIPDHPALVGELAAFETRQLSSGLMKYGAPEGAHDDTVMSLAIGWAGFEGWNQQKAERSRYIEMPPQYVISAI